MNENPGETPNPLNPRPGMDVNPSPSPSPSPLENRSSGAPTPVGRPTSMATPRPIHTPDMPAGDRPVVDQPVASQPIVDQTIMDQPMTPAEPKKKKTGLIIGMLVALFLAVGCGVAAVLISINTGSGDPVAMAINKIMSGKVSKNVSATGSIDVAINDMSSPISKLKIDLNSDLATNSMVNSSKATLTATSKTAGNLSVEIDEMYAESGDLYLKVEGLIDAMEGLGLLSTTQKTTQTTQTTVNEVQTTTECSSDEATECEETINETSETIEGTTFYTTDDSSFANTTASMTSALEFIDGEWIRISGNDLQELMGTSASGSECFAELGENIKQYQNSLVEIYNKNAFIGSADEEVTIEKKNDPIYRVAFNKDKMLNFMSGLDNSEMMIKFNNCQSENGEDTISIVANQDNIVDALSKLPAIYVEVNKDNDITRLYSNLNSGQIAITVDLNFSYDTNVEVSEPTEYQDITVIMQKLFSSMYDM